MGTTPIYGFPYPDPSDLVANYPALGQQLAEDVEAQFQLSGKILQVVYATTTTTVLNSTTTTYADTTLTATITPSSASSRVMVMISQSYRLYDPNPSGSIRLLRDSTTIYDPGVNFSLAEESRVYLPLLVVDSPNTTSATIYKTQFNRNSGIIEVQANNIPSSIALMEIAA